MVQVVKDLNSHIILSYYTVTITFQPTNVTVSSGEIVRFTCVVRIGRQQMGAATDNVKWNDNMGNIITRLSTDPYMVDNDFENVDQDILLTSTLTITNVNTQHAGLYQFVLSLRNGSVMSREASLSILIGNSTFILLFILVEMFTLHRWSISLPSVLTLITICD